MEAIGPVSASANRQPGSDGGHIHPLAATSPAYVRPIRLIPLPAVCEILGLKKSAVLAKVAANELPEKIKFGTSRRASARWIEDEIFAYVWAMAAQRSLPSTTDISPNSVAALARTKAETDIGARKTRLVCPPRTSTSKSAQ